MRHLQKPIVGATVDMRTALDRARDELAEFLRRSGDPTTIAIVIRFIDQMRDITVRVLFCDYSASALVSAGWPQSWMRPRRALACGFLNGWLCHQFRIGYRRTTSDCRIILITGCGWS